MDWDGMMTDCLLVWDGRVAIRVGFDLLGGGADGDGDGWYVDKRKEQGARSSS